MIRITFYECGAPFLTFEDKCDRATAYADWAQLCGYGVTMEAVLMAKVLVLHAYYGCDTGCCGHIVEIDGKQIGDFDFSHPYGQDHVDFIRKLVTAQVGEDHVNDIDFDNCIVLED